MNRAKGITIYDPAEKLNISVATVSRALWRNIPLLWAGPIPENEILVI